VKFYLIYSKRNWTWNVADLINGLWPITKLTMKAQTDARASSSVEVAQITGKCFHACLCANSSTSTLHTMERITHKSTLCMLFLCWQSSLQPTAAYTGNQRQRRKKHRVHRFAVTRVIVGHTRHTGEVSKCNAQGGFAHACLCSVRKSTRENVGTRCRLTGRFALSDIFILSTQLLCKPISSSHVCKPDPHGAPRPGRGGDTYVPPCTTGPTTTSTDLTKNIAANTPGTKILNASNRSVITPWLRPLLFA